MGIATATAAPLTAPAPATWRNWSGSVEAHPAEIARPRDEAELARVVARASAVRVVGTGHSFPPLCDTAGVLVSLDRMDGELGVTRDAHGLVADAPAGWPLRRLTQALWDAGASLPNQGDVDAQTLAGALSTGTHGTGASLGSLSTIAEGFRLMLASGKVVDCDRQHRPDLFEATRLGLGMTGIILRARLHVAPATHLEERIRSMPLGEAIERFDELAATHRHVEFFVFPYANHVLLKTLDPTEDTSGEPRASGSDAVWQAACDFAASVPMAVPIIHKHLARLTRPSRRTGPAWRIFPAERTVRFEEMEYEVPIANGAAALKATLARIRDRRLPLVFPIEYRIVAGDDLWLSPFHAGPCCSVSVHQYAGMAWQAPFSEVEPVLREAGGRPHWGKRHSLTSADVRALYPRADAFARVRREADPSAKLMNPYLRDLFAFAQ